MSTPDDAGGRSTGTALERPFVPVEVRDDEVAVSDDRAPRELFVGGCRERTDGRAGIRPVYVRVAADDRFAHGHGWIVVEEEQDDGGRAYLNFDGLWRRTMFAAFPTADAAKTAYEAAARAELRGASDPGPVDIEPSSGARVPRPPRPPRRP